MNNAFSAFAYEQQISKYTVRCEKTGGREILMIQEGLTVV